MFPEEIIQSIRKNPDMETLSGEKQAVCLLRVLCSGRTFLIMDEPFSGMSPACIERFMENLPHLPKTVITAHHLNEYQNAFDEVIDLS